MTYKLIMLPQPILVSDEKIVCGDMLLSKNYSFFRSEYQSRLPEYNNDNQVRKIIAGIEGLPILDLSAIAEEIGLVDVEKKSWEMVNQMSKLEGHYEKIAASWGYINGFKAAQSLNEKKYSLEDIDKAIEYALDNPCPFQKDLYQDLVKSLSKPKEYNVEVEMEEYDHKEEWSEIGGAFETFKTRIKVTKIL